MTGRAQHQLIGKPAAAKLLLPELSSNSVNANDFAIKGQTSSVDPLDPAPSVGRNGLRLGPVSGRSCAGIGSDRALTVAEVQSRYCPAP